MICSIAVLKCIWDRFGNLSFVRAFSDLEKLLYYKQNIMMLPLNP